MTHVTTDNPRPLSKTIAEDEIIRARVHHREIGDACAITVASWWKAPGNPALLELAATGQVSSVEDLLAEIHREYNAVVSPAASLSLDMLATWAINHHSREGVVT